MKKNAWKQSGRVTSKTPAASASPSALPRGCVARSAGAEADCM